jgi:hypothetical protein
VRECVLGNLPIVYFSESMRSAVYRISTARRAARVSHTKPLFVSPVWRVVRQGARAPMAVRGVSHAFASAPNVPPLPRYDWAGAPAATRLLASYVHADELVALDRKAPIGLAMLPNFSVVHIFMPPPAMVRSAISVATEPEAAVATVAAATYQVLDPSSTHLHVRLRAPDTWSRDAGGPSGAAIPPPLARFHCVATEARRRLAETSEQSERPPDRVADAVDAAAGFFGVGAVAGVGYGFWYFCLGGWFTSG